MRKYIFPRKDISMVDNFLIRCSPKQQTRKGSESAKSSTLLKYIKARGKKSGDEVSMCSPKFDKTGRMTCASQSSRDPMKDFNMSRSKTNLLPDRAQLKQYLCRLNKHEPDGSPEIMKHLTSTSRSKKAFYEKIDGMNRRGGLAPSPS